MDWAEQAVKQLSDGIADLRARIAELERELALKNAEAEGAASLLLDVQKDCIEARRLAIQALDGWDDVSRDLHHYHGSGEWHQDSRNADIRASIDDAGGE